MQSRSFMYQPVTLLCLMTGLAVILPDVDAAEVDNNMWGLCHTGALHETTTTPPAPPSGPYPTYLNSDAGEGKVDETYTLSGNVTIRRGPQEMEADQAVYDHRTGIVDAEGNVRFEQGGLTTQGKSARFNLNTETGEIDQASYQYLEQHAHGRADRIKHESADVTRLSHATYTTCDPEKVDWELRARSVTLNHAEAVGEAYNVTLRLKNVPVFYFPYINFPLNDERKSGLLPPTLGYSKDDGADIAVPIYWNIAPDHDATFTPRLIEKRGLLAKGEFRYLTATSRGEINAEYLPDDRQFGSNRGMFGYQNHTQFNSSWNSNIIANYISDDDYLSELGNSLAIASTTHVERRADLNYNNDFTSFRARAQGYQTLDPTISSSSKPYQRLPQLVLNLASPPENLGTNYRLDSEFVRFERDNSLTGTRLNLTPAIAWPVEREGYFIIPKIGVNHTQYQLDGEINPGQSSDPTRTTPIYSLDSGLYLERSVLFGERQFLHTLEPRLYYLRIPYRDQSDLPRFDTAAYDFSFAQLFRENRFSGPDRIGDADQVSLAVTNRLIDQTTGKEWLYGSLGQIIYLADRRVTLNNVPQTRPTSNIVGEAATRISDRWSTHLDLQWDPELDKVDEGAFQFRYNMDERRLFNAGYRYQRDKLAQTDLSFLWSLNPRWQVLGRWNYSQHDHRTLETLAGFQYESCCWIFRAVNRRYVNDSSGDSNRSLYLQLELKGLASIGQSIEDLLENGILMNRPSP